MTVAQLLASLDSREITEWQAYFALKREANDKPKGSTADDIKAAFAHRIVKKKG